MSSILEESTEQKASEVLESKTSRHFEIKPNTGKLYLFILSLIYPFLCTLSEFSDLDNLSIKPTGFTEANRAASMPVYSSEISHSLSMPTKGPKLSRASIMVLSKRSVDGIKQLPSENEVKVKAFADQGLLLDEVVKEIDFNRDLL